MSPLEQLFALEIEFHRRLRCEAPGTADPAPLHTSYALQSGYEPLLRQLGRVTAQDLERLATRYTLAGDAKDVLAARDSRKVIRTLTRQVRPSGQECRNALLSKPFLPNVRLLRPPAPPLPPCIRPSGQTHSTLWAGKYDLLGRNFDVSRYGQTVFLGVTDNLLEN